MKATNNTNHRSPRTWAVLAPALLAVALACEKVLGTAADRLGTPPLCAG